MEDALFTSQGMKEIVASCTGTSLFLEDFEA